MMEAKIPKEIMEYKEKFALNLTARQIITCILIGSVAVPIYIFGMNIVGKDIASWSAIIVGGFLALFGFYEKNGLKFEKYIQQIFKYLFFPTKRKYVAEDPIQNAINDEYARLVKEQNEAYSKKKKSHKGISSIRKILGI